MRCCITATEKQLLPRTLTSPFSPTKITAQREVCAQALWTHTMQDAGVVSPSVCIKVDATELLKQSQALPVSRPGFGKLGSAGTAVFSHQRSVWFQGHGMGT